MRQSKRRSFKKKSNTGKTFFWISLTVLLLCVSAAGVYGVLAADTNTVARKKAKGTTYYEYTVVKGNKIVPNTLFIGTYLIDLKGLNDTNYQDALQSRKDYDQNNIYYKTELDGGSWHDIEKGESIATISPGSKRISEESMRDLLITVVIGADGIPRDPEDSDGTNPFDNPDPYGLDGLEELKPLVEAYDGGTFKTKSELYAHDRLEYLFTHCNTDKNPIQDGDGEKAAAVYDWERRRQDAAAVKRLESAYDKVEKNLSEVSDSNIPLPDDSIRSAERILMHWSDTRDEYTAEMDGYMTGLWEIYQDYNSREDDAAADAIYSVISNVDAERRARVFYNLSLSETHHGGVGSILSVLLSDMLKSGQSRIGRYYAYMQGGDDNFESTDSLIQALESSIRNCKSSYETKKELGFKRGVTAVSQYSYDAKMDLLPKKKGDKGINAPVQTLVDIKHLEDGKQEAPDRELALLRECILPLQNKILGDYLTRGVPGEYNVNASAEEKREILDPMQAEARDSVSEIEKYVEWAVARISDEAGQKAVYNNQIAWVENIQKDIPQDDYLGYAEIVRKEYEDWLKKKRDSDSFNIDNNLIDPNGTPPSGDVPGGGGGGGSEPDTPSDSGETGGTVNTPDVPEGGGTGGQGGNNPPNPPNPSNQPTPGGGGQQTTDPSGTPNPNNNDTGTDTGGGGTVKPVNPVNPSTPYNPNAINPDAKPSTPYDETLRPDDPDPHKRARYFEQEAAKAIERGDIRKAKEFLELANQARQEAMNRQPAGNTNPAAKQSSSKSNTKPAYRPSSWKNGIPDTGIISKPQTNSSTSNSNNNNNNTNNNNRDDDNKKKKKNRNRNKNNNKKDKSSKKNKSNKKKKDKNNKAQSNKNASAGTTSTEARNAANAVAAANPSAAKQTGGKLLTDSEMTQAISDILGRPFDQLGPDLKGAAVVAFNEFGTKHEDEGALALARQLLDQIMDERNPLCYLKYSGETTHEYVSFGAIDKARAYSGYRLVDEREDGTQVLSTLKGEKNHIFKAADLIGSQTDVYIRGSRTERYSYLEENECKNKTGSRAEYISRSNYAVLVTTGMEPSVRRMVERLEQLAGYLPEP